jgi:NAD(P)-dependent dehydrogenase (short-subunit alcohol dehydrogenase family)
VDVFADEAKMQYIRSRLLVGRHGQPTDIAHAVLFLASDDAAFMTGQTILVDGGRMIA